MVKKTFKIPDMHCSNCAMRLEGIEDELPGIRQIKASYHQQTLEVFFDENQVDEEAIRQAVQRAGYSLT